MKAFYIFTVLFLASIYFVGCSDDFDLEFPANTNSPAGSRPSPSVISLNPTEQKLRGTWYLQTMSTKDTLYNDSLYNRNRSVEFTEITYPGRNRPILNDYALLYAKSTPDAYGLMANEEYSAPAPAIFTIYYSGYYIGPDSATFRISSLSANELVIQDTVQI
jgi:hypothetical protein